MNYAPYESYEQIKPIKPLCNKSTIINKNKTYILRYIKKHNFKLIEYKYTEDKVYFLTLDKRMFEFNCLTNTFELIKDPYFRIKILNPTFINSA